MKYIKTLIKEKAKYFVLHQLLNKLVRKEINAQEYLSLVIQVLETDVTEKNKKRKINV